MNYDIVPLPKDRWKGTIIPLITISDSYYDFIISPLNNESTSDIIFTEKDAEDSSYNLIALTKGVTG